MGRRRRVRLPISTSRQPRDMNSEIMCGDETRPIYASLSEIRIGCNGGGSYLLPPSGRVRDSPHRRLRLRHRRFWTTRWWMPFRASFRCSPDAGRDFGRFPLPSRVCEWGGGLCSWPVVFPGVFRSPMRAIASGRVSTSQSAEIAHGDLLDGASTGYPLVVMTCRLDAPQKPCIRTPNGPCSWRISGE